MGARTAVALAGIAGVLTLGTAAPAVAENPGTSWSDELAGTETAGIAVVGGSARLDPDSAFLAPQEEGTAVGSPAPPLPTGLLTFAPRLLPAPADRVTAVLDADVPAGTLATVDVRARRASGAWTEWVPGPSGTGPLTVVLPEAASEVQGRLVLSGDPAAGPVVRAVRFTAHPAPDGGRSTVVGAEQAPLTYRVFATREGLVGGTTANGHVIAERDHFAALPSRRALAPRDSGDYSVRVCTARGRCAVAPVWDVGPWNTRDDYWNPPSVRQQWADLPQGVPQAQAAYQDGYNGGHDQYDRQVRNPAGIDLGDGLFWDALGLRDNAWVSVEYLWTGAAHVARVEETEQIRAAPDAAATVIGIVSGHATVPVECLVTTVTDKWLRIGAAQFVDAATVQLPAGLAPCPSGDS